MYKGQQWAVFRQFLREEWRLHTRLFGAQRFGFFPVLIGLLVGGTAWILVETASAPEPLIGGVFALTFVLGLHAGSVGIIGRDALRAVLGDVTLLVFSGRTLPLSRRRLLGLFILSDVVYYASFIIAPIAVGMLPVLVVTTASPPALLGSLGLLWVTLVWTFLGGLGTTLAGVGLSTKGQLGQGFGVGCLVLLTAAWVVGIDLVAYSPYAVYTGQAPRALLGAAVGVTIVAVTAVLTVGDQAQPRTTTVRPRLTRVTQWTGSAVAAWILLGVHRSAGGFGALLFSAVILLAVTIGLVDLATRLTGVTPISSVILGSVLGLSGFTTYNWLTTPEDLETYLSQPVGVIEVFEGTQRAFVLTGPPVALLAYGGGIIWLGAQPVAATVGAVLVLGMTVYTYGLTVYLAGRSPNEFLFDTVLFAGFGAATAGALLPPLITAFVTAPLTVESSTGLLVWAILLASIGLYLATRAGPRWSDRYRHGA